MTENETTASPSLFGPITDQDRTRWQLKGSKALTDLLANAFHEQLPSVDWRLTAGSALHASFNRPDWNGQQRREAFDVWVSYLGADRRPEQMSVGRTLLGASVELPGGVKVTLTADWFNKTETEG